MDTATNYGVYVIFSKETADKNKMMNILEKCLEIDENSSQDSIIFLRKCLHREVADTKRWHICMLKNLMDKAKSNGESNGLTFNSYRVDQKPIGNGKTYAYYIPYTDDDMKQSILSMFEMLDGKFLRSGSYSIHHPKLREDGTNRNYLLVSFAKTGNFYPRPFIRTLRALLNDSLCGEQTINVKWCSHRVLRDVIVSEQSHES